MKFYLCKKDKRMESLITTYRLSLDMAPDAFVRSFHDKINWNNRLLGLVGQKGVGKSTLILQHIKRHDDVNKSLYVQADDFYFAGHTLVDLARDFMKNGGQRLYIDEIHKYKGWSTEIKMIYDQLPMLNVVYSGSSILDIKKGSKADLSRRAVEYTIPGLSFREYLNLTQGWNLAEATLDDILAGKVDFPFGKHRPLVYYKQYLQAGYYPYFAEPDFRIKLNQAVTATVEDDIPKYADMPVASAVKLKRLMYVLAKSVPFKPNYSNLSRDLEIGRNQLPDYISYLEKSGLFNALPAKGSGDAILNKIEKIYLNNSNIAYAVADSNPDEGTIRETMFLTWMREKFRVTASDISDFEVDGRTFEVGGKSKGKKQILAADEGYIVADNMEYAVGNKIPIWMFGFLY